MSLLESVGDLFGVSITPNKKKENHSAAISLPIDDEGATYASGGSSASCYGIYVDIDGTIKNDVEQIRKCREISLYPEIDIAIQDIINEAIPQEQDSKQIELDLSDLDFSDELKDKIQGEFDKIISMLRYNELSADIFRRWYIDGRLYFQIIVDKENLRDGIKELRLIDAAKIRKVKEVEKEKTETGINAIKSIKEYFIFNDLGFTTNTTTGALNSNQGIRINTDSIVYVPSGYTDPNTNTVLSYLHKCISGDGRVKTPDGWKYMKDIDVGDSVFSYDTNSSELIPTVVTNKWNNGPRKVISVRTCHTSFKCTEDHRILVKSDGGIYEYVEAQNIIQKKHHLVLPKAIESGKDIKFPSLSRGIVIDCVNSDLWINTKMKNKKKIIFDVAEKIGVNKHKLYSFVYGNHPIEKLIGLEAIKHLPIKLEVKERYFGSYKYDMNIPINVDEEFARLFGFLIGDGWIIDRKDGGRIGFAEGEYEYLNEMYSRLMIKYFGNCKKVVGKNRKSNYHSYYTSNVLGVELLKLMGFITGSRNKRIPEWVFSAKRDIKLAFVQGLMDADGCDRSEQSGGIWAHSIGLANEPLIHDVKELWTNLGYCSGKISKIRQYNISILGIEVKSPITTAWTLYLSKRELPESENVLSIDAIESEESVYDIEVENDNHNFIVNGAVVHNCIRAANQLRMLEDAVVIYRIARAPERRIFYIDVGNLPKMKAEQYMKDIMNRYRNKMVYDGKTGEIRDDKKYMSMLEDFWIPRREGKGTEITTLPVGSAFNELLDVEMFRKKLYQALNVPVSRIEPDTGFSLGRTTEITRDELKFQKFIDRLRLKFSQLFFDALRTQLILKGIVNDEEWENEIRDDIRFKFQKDNYFSELKTLDLLQSKLAMIPQVDPWLGKYFTKQYIQTTVLGMSEEEIEDFDKQVALEKDDPSAQPTMMGMPPMQPGDDGQSDQFGQGQEQGQDQQDDQQGGGSANLPDSNPQ